MFSAYVKNGYDSYLLMGMGNLVFFSRIQQPPNERQRLYVFKTIPLEQFSLTQQVWAWHLSFFVTQDKNGRLFIEVCLLSECQIAGCYGSRCLVPVCSYSFKGIIVEGKCKHKYWLSWAKNGSSKNIPAYIQSRKLCRTCSEESKRKITWRQFKSIAFANEPPHPFERSF